MKKNYLADEEATVKSGDDVLQRLQQDVHRILQIQKRILPFAYDGVYEKLTEGSRLLPARPSEVFPGIEELSVPMGVIQETSREGGGLADMLYVVAMAKLLKARSVFEFGTRFGQTTYHLAQVTPETRVTTLDLPPDERVEGPGLGQYFRSRNGSGGITQLLQDSRAFDPTPYAGKMDFIFIDGDHTYEGVKNDTEKALVMLAPGGTIVWHDYVPKSPGVVQLATELSRQRMIFHLQGTALLVYRDGLDPEPYRGFEKRRARQARIEID